MFPTAIARCNLPRDSDSEDDTKDKGDAKEKGAWEEGAKEEGAKQLVAAPPAVSPEDAQKMTGLKRACFASNRPASAEIDPRRPCTRLARRQEAVSTEKMLGLGGGGLGG